MGSYAFQVTCDHAETCPSGGPDPDDAVFDVRDADISTGRPGAVRRVVTCPVCACNYAVRIGPSGRGFVQADVAAPRLDSISVGSGAVAGGTSVTISGHRLNTTGVVVKFGGEAATGITNQSDGSLDCLTPAGVVSLSPEAMRSRVSLSGVSGVFQEGENLEVSRDGSWIVAGEIVTVGADYLVIGLAAPPVSGEALRGATSAATATAAGNTPTTFSDGETVTGQTSGETATVRSHFTVAGVDVGFSASEWVVGGTSGFSALLRDSAPMVLMVDVSVENENGPGNKIWSAFEYAI